MRHYPRGCHAVQLPDGDTIKITHPMSFYGVVWRVRNGGKDYHNQLLAIRPRGRTRWTVFRGEQPLWSGTDLDVIRMRAALTEV